MNNASSQSYASYLASHNDNPYHLSHIWEFRELATRIAQEQINEIVPQLVRETCYKVMNEAFSGAMKGIEYDVKSILDISIKDLNEQWHSERVTQFIGEAVREELKKSLSSIDISLILQ